jgi:thiol-disulfide isomerase/thioredoxin
MHVLHANSKEDAEQVNKLIGQDKDVFILVYMEGCGPCNATRPEWAKLESALEDQYSKNNKLAVVDLNKDYQDVVKSLGNIDGYPTLKHINHNGKKIQSYEDSAVKSKDRSVDSFINWIESTINKVESTTPTGSPEEVYERLTNNDDNSNKSISKSKSQKSNKKRPSSRQTGGKWTRKYKKSINNCKRPKGFSQKQYCKYGRKSRGRK